MIDYSEAHQFLTGIREMGSVLVIAGLVLLWIRARFSSKSNVWMD